MRLRICHLLSCTSGFLAAIFGIAAARYVFVTGLDSDSFVYSGDIATCAVLGVIFLLDCSLQGLLIFKARISTVLRSVAIICNVAALASIVAVGVVTSKSQWIKSSPYLIAVAIAFGAISVILSALGTFVHRQSRQDDIVESPLVPEIKSMQWPAQQQLPNLAYQPQLSPSANHPQAYAPFNSVPLASQTYSASPPSFMNQATSPTLTVTSPKQAISAPPRTNNPLLATSAAYRPA